jgi:NAD+ kinase
MKVAIYGKQISSDFRPYIDELFEKLAQQKVEVSVYEPFYLHLVEMGCPLTDCSCFLSATEAPCDADFLISIGGDGTFLESMLYLKSSEIPVIGLNTGRLGYLANIGRDQITKALDFLFNGEYEIEHRTLLRVESNFKLFEGYNFALNDVTIQKATPTMIKVDAWIDGDFLNSYWTDGLIIATPTGSTAYSLSVGGPIVMPGSGNFIIAPIASHNLTVRPIVIPDESIIKLIVSGRAQSFLVTVDNRSQVLDLKHNEIIVRKTKFRLKILKLPFNNYFATLRDKLMWGLDKRN